LAVQDRNYPEACGGLVRRRATPWVASRGSARFLRRLSVRSRVFIALVALVALAGAELVINLRAMESAAFMLRRADISYKQLSAYRQLGAEVLEYIVASEGEAKEFESTETSRGAAEQRLAILSSLTAYETQLLRAHGEDESNSEERERITEIGRTLQSIFAANAGHRAATQTDQSAASIYRAKLRPLLDVAVARERDEAAAVEVAMRNMSKRLKWLGAVGMSVQVLVLGFILLLMNRAVLDPLSRLVSDIKYYGRGQLAHRVAVRHHDEFALLGRHINRMARHLERGRQNFLAIKAGLEATVAERTSSLQDKNDELREIDESRRRFFAEVSHELRTPLTAIVGEADVTLRIGSSEIESYRDSLFSILANSTLLKRRIDDLMALARSSDGRLGLQKEAVDLNLIVNEALMEVRGLAKINNIIIRFEAVAAPLLVIGDKARLRQCVLILLDNAVKFSPAGRSVEVIIVDRSGRAELSVIDEGRGITVGETQRVFERFYQTEDGRRVGGSGLGLSIARRLVEAHDGSMVASNREHGGAMVTLMLPTAQSAAA
jgi:two-component system, OmpR family, sensor kinase